MTQSPAILESAFRRIATKAAARSRAEAVQAARNALRRKGWKQSAAAGHLGVSKIHLNYVLNGRRESQAILSAIDALPENPNPA